MGVKDTDITMDDARALVADQALWPIVRDFLWDFAPQVHQSWVDGVAGISGFSGVSGSSRIKAHILSELGVEPCFHVFPKDDWSRLLLLDGRTLELIVKWLGAIVCADELRHVMVGATVRELKAVLSGIYPEVFGYTAYFAKIDFQRGDAEKQSGESQNVGSRPSIVGDVVSTGMSVIDLLLADVPAPLVSRFRFKLPKGLCASESLRLKQETCGAVVTKLLKLKFPEAYKLCC